MRVGLITRDDLFRSRLRSAMEVYYPKEVEWFPLPDPEKAETALDAMGLDLILWERDPNREEKPNRIPPDHLILLQEDEDGPRTEDGPWAVCKYRSIEDWHELLMERIQTQSTECSRPVLPRVEPNSHHPVTICLFTSGAGGTGTTAAAGAFARSCAEQGIRTALLSLDHFPDSPANAGNGPLYGLEDLLYALRSDRYEIGALINRTLIRSESGVFQLRPCPDPLDLFSVTGEEILRICDALGEFCRVRLVVLDVPVDPSLQCVLPFREADAVVLLTDGSPSGNRKTEALMRVLPKLTDLPREMLEKKLALLYNRFQPGVGQRMEGVRIEELGGINRLSEEDEGTLQKRLAELAPMRRLQEVLHV